MERWTFDAQKTPTPATSDRPANLHAPVPSDGGRRGRNWKGHTRRSSVYTKAVLRPRAATAALGGLAAAIGVAAALRARMMRAGGAPEERLADLSGPLV